MACGYFVDSSHAPPPVLRGPRSFRGGSGGGAAAQPAGRAAGLGRLEAYQETITRGEFVRLLETVYAPGGAARGLVDVEGDAARIQMTLTPPTEFRLRFAADTPSAKTAPRAWRPACGAGTRAEGQATRRGEDRDRSRGISAATWARMEERFFQIGDSLPVREGDMTLRVAELLAPQLAQARARRSRCSARRSDRLTPDRPETLRDDAREELARLGVAAPRETYDPALLSDPHPRRRPSSGRARCSFTAISEIRHRARMRE